MMLTAARTLQTVTKSNASIARWVSSSIPTLEKVTINVPTMGDSITEGTIVEWSKGVGEAVGVDDVVALVETDKVTVEIKAETQGIILERFGAVDDTVEVGAPLYAIDTDADMTQAVAQSSNKPPVSEVKEEKVANILEPSKVQIPSSAVASVRSRIPSIKFLGKAGWSARRINDSETANLGNASGLLDGSHKIILEAPSIDPMYGRPIFTEEEMESLMMGGASNAPKLLRYSSGAKFS
mmetsp:Transcript_17536/g.27311  ORF Transcript_17536/g.27311 Transcript_17536/m.27311 type:complete len:239 (-) Transcript_17536:100-816(-)